MFYKQVIFYEVRIEFKNTYMKNIIILVKYVQGIIIRDLKEIKPKETGFSKKISLLENYPFFRRW